MKKTVALFLSIIMLFLAMPLGALAGNEITPFEGETVFETVYEEVYSNGVVERVGIILENIASSYTEKISHWEGMDMVAYEVYKPDTAYKLTDETRQGIVNLAINDVLNAESEAALTKAILSLTAMGKDARVLYQVNSNEPINAIEKLKAMEHSASVWSAPYTLAVYGRSEYMVEEKAIPLAEALMEGQGEDGSWDEYGTVDTTANAIIGLSFYKDYEDEVVRQRVNTAIEKGLCYLSSVQNADGTYSDAFSGANSNSTAMVLMALTASGTDAVNDEGFIKNGKNIIDGILSFATEDNKGFGYTDNSSTSSYSDEQCFKALTGWLLARGKGNVHNVFDFSSFQLVPAREKAEEATDGSAVAPSGDKLTVKVSIKTESTYWLKNYTVRFGTLDASVCDAFVKACAENEIGQTGAESGYVSSVTKNSVTLSEFGNGAKSGWLYKVNGAKPNVGIKDFKIKNGDNIVFYYTEDYDFEGTGGSTSKPVVKEPEKELDEEKKDVVSFGDVKGHWAEKSISFMVEKGYMKGTGENEFSPDAPLSRGMFITVLYRIAGEPKVGKADFEDVKEEDYFASAVAWGNTNKIVKGISKKSFAPHDEITREEMAVMLCRYAKREGEEDADLSTYDDEESISSWAREAFGWANKMGLIKGKTDKSLAPLDMATRAEATEIFCRYINLHR